MRSSNRPSIIGQPMLVFSFSFFLFLPTSILLAQTGWEGKRVMDVRLEPSTVLNPADFAKAQPIRKGQLLRADDVAKAIDGLFATGRFEDIAVETELADGGVSVRFRTKPAFFVGGVSARGKLSAPPNRGQISNSAHLTLGERFREEDLVQAKESIRNVLRANGLYEAQVEPSIEKDSQTNAVFVTFHVDAHKRARYAAPRLEGEKLLSDSTIIKATGWRVPLIHRWRRVTDSLSRSGIQGILARYQKDERLRAVVSLEKLDYDAETRRATPWIQLTAGPKVTIRAVEAKVSKRVLKRYVPVFQEGSLDNDLLVEGERNLRDYFQSKGYYDVDVDFRVLPREQDREIVEYVISQGSRFKLVRVDIAGNRYFHLDDIRERMFLQPSSLALRRGRYSEAFRRKDEENITNLYQSNGFRDVKVTSVVNRNLQGKADQMAVTVNINEGPQWLINDLTVNGIKQVDRETIVSQLVSVQGQPFSERNIAADRTEILTYYYSAGFPNATMRSTWRESSSPYRTDVVYMIDEGDRKFVRDVLITGLHITRRSLVEKHMLLHAGDPLSPLRQTDAQKQFSDLGVFARVDTAIENPEGDTDHKYVLYNFEEASRYTLGLGFGAQLGRFGTPSTNDLSSPAGATGFSPAVSLDASRLNFLGLGHTVNLRAMYSSIEKRASLSYFAPRFRNIEGRNITVSALYDDTFNVRTFASRREEASVQVSQQFSRATTGLLRFAYRRVSVSSVVIPVLLVPQLLQPVRIGMLSANLAQDRRDNQADPHRGIYNTFDIGISTKFLGSQRSFGRAVVRNATYHRISRNLILARQTRFGLIAPFAPPPGITEQESVPLPERFFFGGADSLRAFPFNQAGPRDTGAPVVPGGPSSQPTGFPLGGNALFVNNVEMRFPLIGANIQGVLFHDMGNVFRGLSDISLRFHQKDVQDFNYTVHAVGIGIRYRTPVGPIRLDLAYSVNPPSFVGFSGTPLELLQCNPGAAQVTPACQGVKQNVSHFQFFFSIGQTF